MDGVTVLLQNRVLLFAILVFIMTGFAEGLLPVTLHAPRVYGRFRVPSPGSYSAQLSASKKVEVAPNLQKGYVIVPESDGSPASSSQKKPAGWTLWDQRTKGVTVVIGNSKQRRLSARDGKHFGPLAVPDLAKLQHKVRSPDRKCPILWSSLCYLLYDCCLSSEMKRCSCGYRCVREKEALVFVSSVLILLTLWLLQFQLPCFQLKELQQEKDGIHSKIELMGKEWRRVSDVSPLKKKKLALKDR